MRRSTKFLFFLTAIFFLGFYSKSHTVGTPKAAVQEYARSQPKNIVFSFDLDDVISGKEKIGFTDYFTLIPRIVFKTPKIISLLLPNNFEPLKQRVVELEKTSNGASNIIHTLIQELKEQGYGDLSYAECQLVKRSLKPFLVPKMISNIKKLKAQGYTVVGATNQDWCQHKVYRKRMKELGVDLNELFDVVLTTRVNHVAPLAGNQLSYRLNPTENIYVVREEKAFKPGLNYFKALEQLVFQRVAQAKKIIHTDDKLENIQGATAAGLQAIHFKLAGGKIRTTKKADIEKTIEAWQKEVAQQSILL